MLLRRRVVILPHTILPRYYQQVSYIQSNGNQYIDTGVKPKNTTGIDISFKYLAAGVYGIFGANNGAWAGSSYGLVTYGEDSVAFYSYANSDESLGVTATANYDYRFNRRSNSYTLYRGSSVLKSGSLSSGSFNCSYNMVLFALSFAGSANYKSKLQLYYCKIYDGSTLIRDMYPCYKKTNKIAGLYDTVNKVFYTNSGSGSFTVGSEIK